MNTSKKKNKKKSTKKIDIAPCWKRKKQTKKILILTCFLLIRHTKCYFLYSIFYMIFSFVSIPTAVSYFIIAILVQIHFHTNKVGTLIDKIEDFLDSFFALGYDRFLKKETSKKTATKKKKT